MEFLSSECMESLRLESKRLRLELCFLKMLEKAIRKLKKYSLKLIAKTQSSLLWCRMAREQPKTSWFIWNKPHLIKALDVAFDRYTNLLWKLFMVTSTIGYFSHVYNYFQRSKLERYRVGMLMYLVIFALLNSYAVATVLLNSTGN